MITDMQERTLISNKESMYKYKHLTQVSSKLDTDKLQLQFMSDSDHLGPSCISIRSLSLNSSNSESISESELTGVLVATGPSVSS